MLEQLKELLEMQRVLDEAILKEHVNIYDEKIADQMKIALFVELGELMNEMPTKFKHWKKTAKDNREKALVEYVDALHFQMSLFNYYECDIFEPYHNYYEKEEGYFCDDIGKCLIGSVESCSFTIGLSYLFDLGYILGFTWSEIYETYKAKNAVNYERLKNGY